jgi:hypothetical protein
MSKRIDFVPDIHVTNAGGEPLQKVPNTGNLTILAVMVILAADGKNAVEQTLEPFKLRHIVFLFERVADTKFVEGISDAIEAELLRADVRGIIKRQEIEAEARGYWEFDDAVWTKLFGATMKPAAPINGTLAGIPAVNYVPFILSVRDASTPPPAIELPPVTNGVSAQAS